MIEYLGGIISLLSDINTVHDTYTKISGIFSGGKNDITRVLDKLNQTNEQILSSIERLSDNIWYAPNLEAVQNRQKPNQKNISNLREVRASLEYLQKELNTDILSSAIISTPDKMQEAFNKSPWEVLIEIRPVSLTSKPNNPDLVPILFEYGDIQYIGWQTKGVLPMMFDCQYNDIWVPNNLSIQPLSQDTDTENKRNVTDQSISDGVILPYPISVKPNQENEEGEDEECYIDSLLNNPKARPEDLETRRYAVQAVKDRKNIYEYIENSFLNNERDNDFESKSFNQLGLTKIDLFEIMLQFVNKHSNVLIQAKEESDFTRGLLGLLSFFSITSVEEATLIQRIVILRGGFNTYERTMLLWSGLCGNGEGVCQLHKELDSIKVVYNICLTASIWCDLLQKYSFPDMGKTDLLALKRKVLEGDSDGAELILQAAMNKKKFFSKIKSWLA